MELLFALLCFHFDFGETTLLATSVLCALWCLPFCNKRYRAKVHLQSVNKMLIFVCIPEDGRYAAVRTRAHTRKYTAVEYDSTFFVYICRTSPTGVLLPLYSHHAGTARHYCRNIKIRGRICAVWCGPCVTVGCVSCVAVSCCELLAFPNLSHHAACCPRLNIIRVCCCVVYVSRVVRTNYLQSATNYLQNPHGMLPVVSESTVVLIVREYASPNENIPQHLFVLVPTRFISPRCGTRAGAWSNQLFFVIVRDDK